MNLTRRRLIAISAGLAVLPIAGPVARAETTVMPSARLWTGQALGARASIRLVHPQAETIATRVMQEIDRLEGILSLYRTDSALSRLNRDGFLASPPFELLECLSLSQAVWQKSGGRFDPTVQPLWAFWAETVSAGRVPDAVELKAVLARTGWGRVALSEDAIRLQPGMSLTLNGIGQGYVADRVASLLQSEGLSDILIDTGEFRALGGMPEDGTDPRAGWPVTLEPGGTIALRERALATSAPLGTTFDDTGRFGHILDPETGRPAQSVWQSISVTAPTAAIADALATAACLMPDKPSIEAMIGAFPGARLEGIA